MVQCKACCCEAQHQLSTHYAVLGYEGIGPGLANLVMENNVEDQVGEQKNNLGRKVVTKPSSRFGGVFVLALGLAKNLEAGLVWNQKEIGCSCAKLRRKNL